MSEQQTTVPATAGDKPLLKLLYELGPLIVFFTTNAYAGIFWATGIFMAATAISLALSRMSFGRLPVMPLVTAVFVLVFGGLTLVLQDELFIKLKPTIINSLFAAVALGGLACNWIVWKTLFGEVFALTDAGWRVLQFRWGCFFIVLAILNEIVWRNYSTDTWVSFKVFGIMPLTLVFAFLQIGVLQRHALDAAAGGGGPTPPGGTSGS